MKITELRDRSEQDLATLEGELARDLWKTRFANYTNQLDDTAKIGRLRREIARVKTVLTQKQSDAAPQSGSKKVAKAPKAAPVKKAAAEKKTAAPKAAAEKKSAPKKAAAKTTKAKG